MLPFTHRINLTWLFCGLYFSWKVIKVNKFLHLAVVGKMRILMLLQSSKPQMFNGCTKLQVKRSTEIRQCLVLKMKDQLPSIHRKPIYTETPSMISVLNICHHSSPERFTTAEQCNVVGSDVVISPFSGSICDGRRLDLDLLSFVKCCTRHLI